MSDPIDGAVSVGAPAAGSAGGASKSAKSKRSQFNVTAIHLLKSALITLFGAQCATTQSTDFSHATKAELTVSYEGDTLTQENFNQIDAKCNELIQANLPVAELPNLPATDLESCQGPRFETTGPLRIFKLVKMRIRKNSKGYEFSFVVHQSADEMIAKNAAAVAATNSKKPQAVQQAAVASASASTNGEKSKSGKGKASTPSVAPATKASSDYVVDTTQSIFNELIIPAFANLQLTSSNGSTDPSTNTAASSSSSSSPSASTNELTPAQLAELKLKLLPQLESYLVMFANQAYTRGYTAKQAGNGNVDLARLL